jgi:hypothetical protein
MATEPKKVDDPMGNALVQQMVRSSNALKSDFTQTTGAPMREISEADFRQHFLPYFCGELPSTPEVKQVWCQVAGTPFNPVAIIGDGGRVVATVPPLVDTNVIRAKTRNTVGKSALPVDSIMSQAVQRASLSPQLAQTQMVRDLTNRYRVTENKPSPTLRQQWEALLTYFGKSFDPKKAAAAKPDADESDFEYD